MSGEQERPEISADEGEEATGWASEQIDPLVTSEDNIPSSSIQRERPETEFEDFTRRLDNFQLGLDWVTEQITSMTDQITRALSDSVERICTICLEEILHTQVMMTLSCEHNFHLGCIVLWHRRQPTCPNCRKPSF